MFTQADPQSQGTNPGMPSPDGGMPPQGGMQPPTPPQAVGPSPEEQAEFTLDKAIQSVNLAESIRKRDKRKGTTLLAEIGNSVVEDFETDETSREDWMTRNEEWMKLATQVVEKKSFPWEGAANVKYPLLTTAAIQFASRAYPSLVPSFDIVKAKVLGPDPDGSKTDAANTLSTHMSYQILYEMDGWEEDLDVLCFVLPIAGVMFKKTYYSSKDKCNVSELVHAKDFVVNYYTKSLIKSSRYTHILYYTANEIKERQNYKLFLEYDEDFEEGEGDDTSVSKGKTSGTEATQDEETPRKILEQYRRIDLDEDGYKEPYIVTVDYQTKQVLRLTANFRSKGVEKDEKGKVLCITACQWFTKYGFIPNPDGGFYDLGFGLLLGGINESVNTLTNQLLDSGTQSILQAGFLAKGLRLTERDLKFRVGEWKVVNAIGDDLRKSIVPLPSQPPSPVLYQLLGTLAQAGKELASVAEIFTGKMPGQNTPASTTMATIEQGLKVFTSIYKRIYRSMQQEFIKLYDLNALYMPTEITRFVADVNGKSGEYEISRDTYQGMNVKIMPAADPNMVSETQKLMKIQGMHELVQYGNINVKEMTRQALTFQGQDSITELMKVPPPPQPIELQLKQIDVQENQKDRQLEMMKLQSESRKRESEIVLNIAKAKQLGDEQGALMLEAQLEREKATMDMNAKWMDLLFQREKHQMDMKQKAEMHQQDMAATESETQLNLATKSAIAGQNIDHNQKKNDQSIKLMGEKAKAKETNEKSVKGRVG